MMMVSNSSGAGPSGDYGGLAISTREVMPRAAAYEALLNQGH